MGCGARTTVHPTSPCTRGPQSVRMSSKKRVEAVHDLDAMTVLPNSPTQSPEDKLDLEESSDEQMFVERVEDGARLWSSMNTEDVEANRNQPFPTPPDRRMHDRHLRRIEDLGRQMAVAFSSFTTEVWLGGTQYNGHAVRNLVDPPDSSTMSLDLGHQEYTSLEKEKGQVLSNAERKEEEQELQHEQEQEEASLAACGVLVSALRCMSEYRTAENAANTRGYAKSVFEVRRNVG
ncbi:hypothetical protein AK812_SmicGene9723 [Symbiodinium microadriaticum]|uniref:Uncharacterized protein n=1 Tax=Symbiodinium microadriaticum TaxID=2951 RepID=A0A1Q9EHR1_SYMMI|nr:hypothetical protein AK812_SmicGene9723 [Symbiodinium microadriaticum]